MKYILLCTFWIIWCFLHSFFISNKATTWFKKLLGNKFAFYRIFYNLFSLITVLPLLYWQTTIQGPVVITLSPYLLFFKYLTMISGIILIIGAFFSFDVLEFFGIRQIISKRKESKISISRHGFYGVIRHPMYLGGFIFFIALMTNAPLGQFLGYLILAIYMIIGTIREDRRLTNELGEIYRSYQKEVPMFLPRFLWRKKDKC